MDGCHEDGTCGIEDLFARLTHWVPPSIRRRKQTTCGTEGCNSYEGLEIDTTCGIAYCTRCWQLYTEDVDGNEYRYKYVEKGDGYSYSSDGAHSEGMMSYDTANTSDGIL